MIQLCRKCRLRRGCSCWWCCWCGSCSGWRRRKGNHLTPLEMGRESLFIKMGRITSRSNTKYINCLMKFFPIICSNTILQTIKDSALKTKLSLTLPKHCFKLYLLKNGFSFLSDFGHFILFFCLKQYYSIRDSSQNTIEAA